MKILVTPRSFGKTDPALFDLLKNAGLDVSVNDTGGILDRVALAVRLVDCDGVILGVDPLDASVLAAAPKLKAVAKYGVGVDNIDLAECERRGIKISRTVGANADAVADFAFSLILAVARRVVVIDRMCRNRDWTKTTGIDVSGKTLGLIGTGAIGRGVARRAKGFGMDVIGYDVFWNEAAAAEIGMRKVELDDIYREADFISVHAPLTEGTYGMIGAEELGMMKKTAVVINTARGGIVNENALLDALVNKRIYGAGIDAFETEPPVDNRWFTLDNIVIGSHSAASTDGATEKMGRMAAENLLRDLGL